MSSSAYHMRFERLLRHSRDGEPLLEVETVHICEPSLNQSLALLGTDERSIDQTADKGQQGARLGLGVVNPSGCTCRPRSGS